MGIVLNQEAIDSVLNCLSYSAFCNGYYWKSAGVSLEWRIPKWL